MTSRTRTRWPWIVTAVAFAAALAFGALVGCNEPEPLPSGERTITRLPEPDDVLDEELMLSLAQAKNFHHKAKVYMSDGNLAEAAAQMEAILAIPFPPAAPEGDDVRLDARALLAKLLVAQNKIDEAMTVVDQGIGGARRDSFFLANLYTVKGEVHQARATQLEGQSADKQRVSDEKRAAIMAFDRSIEIDNALVKQLVEERARRQREGGE
jgi:hypothetical protein